MIEIQIACGQLRGAVLASVVVPQVDVAPRQPQRGRRDSPVAREQHEARDTEPARGRSDDLVIALRLGLRPVLEVVHLVVGVEHLGGPDVEERERAPGAGDAHRLIVLVQDEYGCIQTVRHRSEA